LVEGGLLAQLAASRALIEKGEPQAAVEAARETAHLYPNIAAVALALGQALMAAGHLPTAIAEFQRALRIDPALDDARFAIGCAWLEAGEAQKALEAFAQLEETPDVFAKMTQANEMLTRPRSDAGYVRHLFDQFSADYDARMIGQLGYQAPRILRELADLVIQPPAKLRVLDLGCGTGLSGAAFKDIAVRLDGIDLSPRMIEKARARGIYDSLKVADLETALDGEAQYDLVLAADTIVYVGDMDATLAAAHRALTPDGFFLFTVEKKDGEGFELETTRRWRHSETYLRARAAHAGFKICGFVECSPRSEAGVPVDGFALALQR
jgi:predicted TPR repeat methyltransferase